MDQARERNYTEMHSILEARREEEGNKRKKYNIVCSILYILLLFSYVERDIENEKDEQKERVQLRSPSETFLKCLRIRKNLGNFLLTLHTFVPKAE